VCGRWDQLVGQTRSNVCWGDHEEGLGQYLLKGSRIGSLFRSRHGTPGGIRPEALHLYICQRLSSQ
jgi:hypothetical protein